MFGSKIGDYFEVGINWQKPDINNVKYQKCVDPDLKKDLVTFFTLGHVQM